MACGDHKWGTYRQQCSKEYRTGETCGLRLIMSSIYVADKCKTCDKIDTKNRRIKKEHDNIARWSKEKGRSASIQRSQDMIADLEGELNQLMWDRHNAAKRL